MNVSWPRVGGLGCRALRLLALKNENPTPRKQKVTTNVVLPSTEENVLGGVLGVTWVSGGLSRYILITWVIPPPTNCP